MNKVITYIEIGFKGLKVVHFCPIYAGSENGVRADVKKETILSEALKICSKLSGVHVSYYLILQLMIGC